MKKTPVVYRRYDTALATQDDWILLGICPIGNDRLVTVESNRKPTKPQSTPPRGNNICLYDIEPDRLKLLDDGTRLPGAKRPRVDEIGRIYIPYVAGVVVLEQAPDNRLVARRSLRAQGKLDIVASLAVLDDTRLCVTVAKPHVYLVDTQTDCVIDELERPTAVVDLIDELEREDTNSCSLRIFAPCAVSAPRGLLVGWSLDTRGYIVVIYPHGQIGSPTLISADGMGLVDGLCVSQRRHGDGVRYFVSDVKAHCVLILDEDGEIRHRLDSEWSEDIAVDPDSNQFWMSYWNSGQILVFQS